MESNEGHEHARILELIAGLEKRIGRIESYLQIPSAETEPPPGPEHAKRDEDDLEFEVGQKWFAKAGIVVLAFGMAFVLTFPYHDLPPVVPSVFGFLIAGGMMLIARVWRSSFTLVSQYLFGAGLVLSYFSTLRLYFFSPSVPLQASSPLGIILLALAVCLIFLVSLRRGSVYLTNFSLIMGCTSALATDTPIAILVGLTLVAAASLFVHSRFRWDSALFVGMGGVYAAMLLFVTGNPFLGHDLLIIVSPGVSRWFLMFFAALFATSVLRREDKESEGAKVLLASGLNAGLSYGLFLVLTLAAAGDSFVLSHCIASAIFLVLAILFWTGEQSRLSTFIYAMFGYMALSVALLKAFSPPNVFVWLSLQSILVLSTAIWFRSRFIVVANFIIFLAIVVGYLVVSAGENGMSLGFGVVALISARILNWQQSRLELKTEMMRNAYLISAFFAFPYALYFLMPPGYVAVSWVGMALFYYLMSVLIKRQKYRWMGHLTLGLTVLYLMIIGIIQLEGSYRILSFLVLGVVLIVVSLVFTRLRARRRTADSEHS